ncbi:MAG: hypothetical protein OEZ43_00265 [Gammaproteobacteria bacterium]|nr:hypothetical protein [Gammaproteobacteria bacterium]
MSQEQTFETREKAVVDAYHASNKSEPGKNLDAAIMQIAREKAEATAPLAHTHRISSSRIASLSLAATIVLSVSVVLVLQREAPKEIRLGETEIALEERAPINKRQASDVQAPFERNSSGGAESKAEVPAHVKQAPPAAPLEKSLSAPVSNKPKAIELEAASEMSEPSMAASGLSLESEAMPERMEEIASFGQRSTAESDAAPASAATPAAPRARMIQKPARILPRTYAPPLDFAQLVAGLPVGDERELLSAFIERSSKRREDWLWLWSKFAQAVVGDLIQSDKQWSHIQMQIAQAKVIAKIDEGHRRIYLFDREILPVSSGDAVLVVKQGDSYKLDYLRLRNKSLEDTLQQLRK